MAGRMSMSKDAKSVQAALSRAFPAYLVSTQDTRDGDTGQKIVAVGVIGYFAVGPYSTVSPDEADQLARGMYDEGQGASSRPVSVMVTAEGGSEHYCSRGTRLVDAVLDPLSVPDSMAAPASSEAPAAGETAPTVLLTAEVRFWDDDSASVVFFEAEPDLPAEQKLERIVRIVPHYYAKIMYNLDDCEAAEGTAAQMNQSSARMLLAVHDSTEQASDGVIGPVSADVLPEGLELVSSRDAEPLVTYAVSLIRPGGGGSDSYGVLLEYDQEGAESYYGPVSLVFLTQAVVSAPMPWWVPCSLGYALRQMSETYSQGSEAWTSLLALERTPTSALDAALSKIGAH